MKKEKYNVTGMTCAACQANVTRCVQKLDGVTDVNVSLLANQMTVDYDETKLDAASIIRAVEASATGLPRRTKPRRPGAERGLPQRVAGPARTGPMRSGAA